MWIHLLTLELIYGASPPVVVTTTTTPGGVRRGRYLRRSSKNVPRLPWDESIERIEEQSDVVIAKPIRKRVKLPAEIRAALDDAVPIRSHVEIQAPRISIPELGTAVLQLSDDEEEAVILALMQ